jgi:curved DNA-binding protein CbpA
MNYNKDYYKILNISKNSTKDDIKKAYRKLAIKFHPDKNKNNKQAENKFKEIGEAYEILSDENKKREYDIVKNNNSNNNNYNFGRRVTTQTFHFKNVNDPNKIINMFFNGRNMNHFNNMFENKRKYVLEIGFIKNNSKVHVHSLKNNKYNEKVGIIKGFHNQKNRYIVNIDNKEDILLRDENFLQLLKNVKIRVPTSKFNNNIGNIISFKNNYVIVELQNKVKIALTKDKLIVPNNTNIILKGLKNIKYNNKRACIIKYYDKFDAYLIKLSNKSAIRVNRMNCIY